MNPDRVAGVLVGAACGDALGVPYEFATPPGADAEPAMLGGGLGPYAPGEWSDDTQMTVCVAEVAASGADLRTEAALDAVAAKFVHWRRDGASDIGTQTRAVLDAAPHPTAAALRAAAAAVHQRTGRSAGNGSLMRTAPVALAFPDDPAALAEAARAVSDLTHADPLAGDACVLWCAGIRRAVRDGTLDGVREGLDLLPAARRDLWAGWLADPPARFTPNGFVVTALQAAWAAVTRSGGLSQALAAAVRIGDDTDTVAAIAGALAGARWGRSAIPARWQADVHGWPGLRADDLARLAVAITRPRAAGTGR